MTWWRRISVPTTVFVSDFRIALKCFMSLGDLASIQGGLKYNCRLCPKSQKYLWEVWRINIQRCMYLETWKPGNKPVLETQDEMDLRSQHFHLQWISETVHWGFAEVNEGEKPDENKTLVKDLQWTPILDIREDIFCEHPLGGAHPECQRCNVPSCFEHLRQLKDRRPGPTAFGRSPHSVSFVSVEKSLTPSGLTRLANSFPRRRLV